MRGARGKDLAMNEESGAVGRRWGPEPTWWLLENVWVRCCM